MPARRTTKAKKKTSSNVASLTIVVEIDLANTTNATDLASELVSDISYGDHSVVSAKLAIPATTARTVDVLTHKLLY
jgi:hypothetical protein